MRDGVRRRALQGAAALHGRPRGVPRRGDLHLRRRRRRAGGGAQGVLRRPELRLPDLRRRRAGRPRPVRRPDQEGRRRGPRAGGPAGAAVPVRARQHRRQVRPRPRRRPRSTRSARAPGSCSSIRDRSKVDAFAREVASMVGPSTWRRRAPRCAGPSNRPRGVRPGAATADRRGRAGPARRARPLPHLRDPRFNLERETLKLVIQQPMSIGRTTTEIGPDDFTHPTYRAVWALVEASGGTVAGAADAPGRPAPRERATDPAVAAAVSELGVEPLKKEPTAAYVAQHVVRAARAHCAAADRRDQVEAAAHQPGRARRRRTTGCSASWPRWRSTGASSATGSSGRSEAAPSDPAPPSTSRRGSGCWPGRRPRIGRRGRRHPGGALPARPAARRVPWEQVEAADWDAESETLRLSEVGTWGEPRPTYSLALTEPGRLLELVRERITASVVLQRHVPIHGKRGVRVIARRAPTGSRELTWLFEYDEGIDPADPFVDHAAREALTAAHERGRRGLTRRPIAPAPGGSTRKSG